LALALSLGGAACGGGDDVADKIAEEAGVSTNEQGNVAVTDKDGNEVEVGSDVDLPDDWPDDLPLPDGTKVISASSNDQTGFVVSAGLDGDVTEVGDEIKGTLEDAGYTIDSDTSSNAGGIEVRYLGATGPEYMATVTVSDSPAGADVGNLTLGYTLTPAQG
jgi:hypothetical protein